MTPRQELVLAASQQYKRWREAGEWKVDPFGGRRVLTAEDAVIAVLDGIFDPGSMGEKMRAYYADTKISACTRLLGEIVSRSYRPED